MRLKDPNVIDFGEVCVRSVSIKNLEFLNTLDQPIHVEIEVLHIVVVVYEVLKLTKFIKLTTTKRMIVPSLRRPLRCRK